MANWLGLKPDEQAALTANLAALIVLILLAWLSASKGWLLLLAGSVGGLGGIVHEFAQSKGQTVFFQKHIDKIRYGQWTRVNSDREDRIRHRHEFVAETVLTP